MFGFAAMLNKANKWATCRHVQMLLLALVVWCAIAGTVAAQSAIILTFSGEVTPFAVAQRESIQRGADYWNEVISVSNSGGPLTIRVNQHDAAWTTPDGMLHPPIPPGGAHAGGIDVCFSMAGWSSARNTQLKTDISSYESVMIHELGHSLGIRSGYYDDDGLIDGIAVNGTGTALMIGPTISEGTWCWHIWAPAGTRILNEMGVIIGIIGTDTPLHSLAPGTILEINPGNPYKFRGENAVAAWGDGGTGIAVTIESRNIGAGSTLVHPSTPYGNMNAFYDAYSRPFFSEVELAIMQDLGHIIDIKNYFGQSFYQPHAGTITVTNDEYPIILHGMYGVGLHLVASGNTLVVETDITSTGYGGAGIRIEGNDNTVIIREGVTVSANGESGMGVLMTHNTDTGGSTLLNQGTIEALGPGGTGVYINLGEGDWFFGQNLNSIFDNSGTINAGPGNNAIYINEPNTLGAYGSYPWQGTGINLMKGTSITGNISNHPMNTFQALTFGKLAGADGFAMDVSDPDDFVITIDGGLSGAFDFETWGGTTIITNDLNIPGSWIWVGYGTENSTLILRGDVRFGSGGRIEVLEKGTFVAAGPGGGTTISVDYVLVREGGTFTASVDTRAIGRLTIDGGTFNMWGNETFRMEAGSTLQLYLGANNQSDRIRVLGDASLGDDGFMGGININLLSAFTGTFTLLTANTLEYDDNATVLFNGNAIVAGAPLSAGGGRKTIENYSTEQMGNSLYLTIELASAVYDPDGERIRITWTGAVDNEWDTIGENWVSDDGVGDVWFLDGDGVTFSLSGTHTINVSSVDGPRVVSDMTVKENGNWIFEGGDIRGDANHQYALDDATGMLVLGTEEIPFTGVVTLLNEAVFLGNGDTEFNEAHPGVSVLIDSGTLQLGNGGTTGWVSGGDIENHGHLIFNRSDDRIVNFGIFGSGALTQRGTGELRLLGDRGNDPTYTYTYTGATTVDRGWLRVSNLDGTSEVIVRNGARLSGLYYTSTITAYGDVDNQGRIFDLRKFETMGDINNRGNGIAGNGLIDNIETLIAGGHLYNNNSGIIRDIGEIQAGSVYNVGLIEEIGAINVDNELVNTGGIWNVGSIITGDDLASSGIIGNVNSVFVDGTLTNTGYITGVPLVYTNEFMNQGHIIVGQQMDVRLQRYSDTPVALLPRGTLTNDHGILTVGTTNAAGNITGVGTLNIDGNFENITGLINIYMDGDESSRINVTNGSATINGGKVNVLLNNNTFVLDKQYVFLDVRDADREQLIVNTELSAIGIMDPLLDVTIDYNEGYGGSYWVSLSRTFLYTGVGETENQRALGRYADLVGEALFSKNPNGDARNVLLALDHSRLGARGRMMNDSHDPLCFALDQISGSVYGTMTTASFQNMVMMHASLSNVLRRDYNTIHTINAYYGRMNPNPTGNLWGMIYGHGGKSEHDGNVNGYRQSFSGIMVGYDRLNERQKRLGLFASVGKGYLSSELRDKVESHEIMIGHYARRDGANGYTLLQAGIGTHRYDTKRNLTFGYFDPVTQNNYSIQRTATNQHSAFLLSVDGEMGLRYRNTFLNFSPFVGLQYTGLVRQGFTERGAGSLSLTSEMADYHSVRAKIGMRLDSEPFRVRRGLLSFYGNAAWSYEFEVDKRHSVFSARFSDSGNLTGTKYTVRGNDPGRDWVQAGAGVNHDFNANLRIFTGYDAYANQRQVLHAGQLGFIWQR